MPRQVRCAAEIGKLGSGHITWIDAAPAELRIHQEERSPPVHHLPTPADTRVSNPVPGGSRGLVVPPRERHEFVRSRLVEQDVQGHRDKPSLALRPRRVHDGH